MENAKEKLPNKVINLISSMVKYIETADEKATDRSFYIAKDENSVAKTER